ncbi:MAG: DUF502 domain-containing protein [Candidatus Edwardsbacteria bacterium]
MTLTKPKEKLRKIFITGLVALLPLFLTLYLTWFLLKWGGSILGNLLHLIPPLRGLPTFPTVLLGFLLLLGIIYLVGLLTSHLLGRQLLLLGEKLLGKVPLVRSIYSAFRQITESFLLDKAAFREVVIIEYPRPGLYAIGFLTNEIHWTLKEEKESLIAVFLPSTPQPITGWVVLVPEKDLIRTNFTIEEGLKMIISGGIVAPLPQRTSHA